MLTHYVFQRLAVTFKLREDVRYNSYHGRLLDVLRHDINIHSGNNCYKTNIEVYSIYQEHFFLGEDKRSRHCLFMLTVVGTARFLLLYLLDWLQKLCWGWQAIHYSRGVLYRPLLSKQVASRSYHPALLDLNSQHK